MHAAVALAAATLSALAGCTMLHNRPAVVLAMAAPAPVLLTIKLLATSSTDPLLSWLCAHVCAARLRIKWHWLSHGRLPSQSWQVASAALAYARE